MLGARSQQRIRLGQRSGGGRPSQLDPAAIMRNLSLKKRTVFETVTAGRASWESAVRHLEQFITVFLD